jgi:hypothetical protein
MTFTGPVFRLRKTLRRSAEALAEAVGPGGQCDPQAVDGSDLRLPQARSPDRART